MISDPSILSTSRLHSQVMEHLWNAAQSPRPKARWVRLGDLMDHLADRCGWATYRALREGPGRQYTAYLDGTLAVLEEMGCVVRKGNFYSFGRFLRSSDLAPVVSDSGIGNEGEAG